MAFVYLWDQNDWMKSDFGGRLVFSALGKSNYESSVGNILFKTECNIPKSNDGAI